MLRRLRLLSALVVRLVSALASAVYAAEAVDCAYRCVRAGFVLETLEVLRMDACLAGGVPACRVGLDCRLVSTLDFVLQMMVSAERTAILDTGCTHGSALLADCMAAYAVFCFLVVLLFV